MIELVDAEAYVAALQINKLLTAADPAIRSTAAYALGYMGIQEPETIGSTLVNLLNDPEVIVRSEVVEALGGLHYKRAIARIQHTLRNDPEPLVRASAAEALGDIGDEQALTALEDALKDADEAVRAYAANSIGLLGTAQLLPKLEVYLKSEPSVGVQAELLGAMYRLGAVEALSQLLNLLDNADEDLATCILNLLTDLTERKIPSTLIENASEIRQSLSAIAQRFPLLRYQAEEIGEQLATGV
ncbi:HEAT repeat domain-containing protein [Coleofasciculus sp. G2-EDA-02]|uniref:HEAT repeat domain-containing protein n=1 Tax=Coleofasciculus sp. G2-EDA-02 TaxID=3069529 RepID=UPI0032F72A13